MALSSPSAVAAVPTAATVLELNVTSPLHAPWWLVATSAAVGVLSAVLIFVERVLRLRAVERTLARVLPALQSITGEELAEVLRAVQRDRGSGRRRGPSDGDPSS